jgi:hypothetical protein
MKRVPVLCATIALIMVPISQAGAEEKLEAAFAAAPPLVRELQCRDIGSLSSADSASVDQWFGQVMAPIARTGMGLDQLYAQFLADCARNPGSSAISAAVELRNLLE